MINYQKTKKSMITKIHKKLGIAHQESLKVKIAWILRLFFQVGFVVSWTIVTALFVEHFGIKNLPYFFLSEGILFIGGAIFASFLLPKLKLETFLISTILFTLAFLGISLNFSSESLWFFIFVILAKDLFFSQINIALYRQNESFFSPTAAQKIMPIIESAITIGAILGAFLTIEFLRIVETKFVLLIWGLGLLSMGILIFFVPSIIKDIPHFHKHYNKKKVFHNPLLEAIHGLKNIKFLKQILFVLILQSAVFTIIEFEFTKDVQSHIAPHHQEHDEHHEVASHKKLQASLFTYVKEKVIEKAHHIKKASANIKHKADQEIEKISTKLIAHETLAHDLGMFHLIFGIISLIVQLLLTSRILQKLGVIGSLISYFGILVVSIFTFIVGGIKISGLRAIQHGFHSIGESSYHLSFYSIFSHGRESIRLFLEGIIKPLGIIFSVLLILISPSTVVAFFALLFTIGIIAIIVFMKKSFTDISKMNLQEEDNIHGKLHSIEVLSQKGHYQPITILGQELQKNVLHPIIKEKIISTITKLDSPEIVHIYTDLLKDSKQELDLKKKILESCLKFSKLDKYWNSHAFAQHHFLNALKSLFEQTDDLYLKKVLIMNLFKHLPPYEVVPFFLKTMKNLDEKIKSICLRSCTIFEDKDIVMYLRPYLMHPSPRIRGHAAIALWKFESHGPLRNIIHGLIDNEEDEKTVIAGIYSIGETKDVHSKDKLFEVVYHGSDEQQLHALIALAKLGEKSCIPRITEILFRTNVDLANKAFFMLDRIPDDIREAIQNEVQFEVSKRVLEILKPRKIKYLEDLSSLSDSILKHLKRLYRIAEKYDDLVLIEKILNQNFASSK